MVKHMGKFEGPATVWHLPPDERRAFMKRVRRATAVCPRWCHKALQQYLPERSWSVNAQFITGWPD